jgi:hypothetical protein
MTILEEYELVCSQLTDIQTAITTILLSKKKYEYANTETKHIVENLNLADLTKREQFLIQRKSDLASRLGCVFVQMKNR